jgi:cell division protein FtsN
MSRKSGSADKGAPMLAGILLGLLVGAALAAGLGWYVLKSPSSFLNKKDLPVTAKPHDAAKSAVPFVVPPVAAVQTPASNAGASAVVGTDGKPRFEFYKVLTDKPDGGKAVVEHSAPHKPGEKPPVREAKPVAPQSTAAKTADKHTYYLQAGAFAKAEEAERLKVKLTLLGMEVNVQQAATPDGARHRVRLGPYRGADEMNKIRATLKQNSVETFPIRMQ